MVLLTKSLFAIFMVIFVFLLFFVLIRSRITQEETQQEFDYYDKYNKVLLAVISNSNCLSFGNTLSSDTYTTVHGMLDYDKLEAKTNKNKDLWCVENFDFIYNLEIQDEAHNTWNVGPLDVNPIAIEDSMRFSLPVVVRFDNGIVHYATISMNAYLGTVPRFYGAIKQACVLKEERNYPLLIKEEIKYYQLNNTFYIGDHYFHPYFSCAVSNFTIPKGKSIVYFHFDNGRLEVDV